MIPLPPNYLVNFQNIPIKKETLLRIADSFENSFLQKTIQHYREFEVSLPLRINWCGTWTDTPPYCLDNGGKVVNASVKIGGISGSCLLFPL